MVLSRDRGARRWIAKIETVMLSGLKIYRAAEATITRYGDGAGLHAAQRADELLAAGDMEGRRVWHRIEEAIDELLRTAPGEEEVVH